MPKFITLAYDYTLNGMVKWAANVAHEATDELHQLVADGVEGVEHELEALAAAIEGEPTAAEPVAEPAADAAAEGAPEAQ